MGAAAGAVALGVGLGLSWPRIAGAWSRAGAILDADFAGGRFAFAGRNHVDKPALLAALGGTETGGAIAIGPYAIPGAPEKILNGDFSGVTQQLTHTSFVDAAGGVGTVVDNGDGTFTATAGAAAVNARFLFSEAALVDGRRYTSFLDVVAITGTVAVDWCDVVLGSVSAPGQYAWTASRADYTGTFRFFDLALDVGESVTFRAPTISYVDSWEARGNGTISVSGGICTLQGNGGNIPGFQQAVALEKGHAYQFRARQRKLADGGTPSWTISSSSGLGGTNACHMPDGGLALHEVASSFSADAATMYVGGRWVANPANGHAGDYGDASIKQVLPFAGFAQGGFAAIVSGVMPAAASGDKVIFEASCGGKDGDAALDASLHERNRVRLVWDSGKHLRLIVTARGTEQANLDLGLVEVSTAFEVVLSVKANEFRASLVGEPVLVATSGDLPGIARIYLKRQNATGSTFDGTLDRVTLFPAAWTEAEFLERQAARSSIAAWGDSLTASAGATSAATRYPAVAAAAYAPHRSISNLGIGGQNSTAIAARQGGRVVTVTVAGNQVPASGAVVVTAKNINVLFNSGTFAGEQKGWLAGVYGAMTTDGSGNWTFVRAVSGSAVACPPGSQFLPELAVKLRSRTQWLWLGRNGAQSGYSVTDDIAACVSWLGHDRYLVGAVLTHTGDGPSSVATIQALNATLAASFGPRFVDTYAALAAANNGSPQDLSDAANGFTPASLRSDAIHLNDAGYAVVAAAFKARSDAMGW